jgi:hypothetical protein
MQMTAGGWRPLLGDRQFGVARINIPITYENWNVL